MTRALRGLRVFSKDSRSQPKTTKSRSRPFSTRLLNRRRGAQRSNGTRDPNLDDVSVPSPTALEEQTIRSDSTGSPPLVPCTEPAGSLQHARQSTEQQLNNQNNLRAHRRDQSSTTEVTDGETASRTVDRTGSSSPNTSDNRLQTNIDVLASLLSMATAATASSLLNNHSDVLSALSSDSPGSQLSPQRARVAWSILEHLFHLRSNRRTTGPGNMELLQDLSLALLTSRFMSTPPLGPVRERPALRPGSFERFLVDVHSRVRASLQEDHERSASGTEPRRLNWWQAFQFPVIPAPRNGQSGLGRQDTSPSGSSPGVATDSSTGPGESSPQGQAERNLIPVVLVGLRSLPPNSPNFTVPAGNTSSGTTPTTGTGPTATSQGQPQMIFPEPAMRPNFDDVDTITSSYVIIVLGGHYPPGHRYVSATNSDESGEFDLLWDLVDLAAAKSPTVTQEELSRSNLRCFLPSQIASMNVAANTAEKCLICLDDYTEDRQLRQMSCMHAFHRDCIDRWLTEGQNGCPMCRQVAVQRPAEEHRDRKSVV